MVKADEERKSPGPDWNRRLKRLLIFEILAALAGLALFYGYLETRPFVTLAGLSIATAPRPLAVVDGVADSRPPATPSAALTADRPLPGNSGLPVKADEEFHAAAGNLVVSAPESSAPVEKGGAGSGPSPAAAPPSSPAPPASSRAEASGSGPAAAVVSSPQSRNKSAPSPVLPSTSNPSASPSPVAAKSLIEVGDFVLPARRAAALARLRELGVKATVLEQMEPTPMYRVYLGPFAAGKEALAMRAVSRSLGDQPFLERRPEGYFLIVSSFYLKANVKAWLRKYRQAGYELRVMREVLPIRHWLLLVDAARAGFSPDELLERLHRAGFSGARKSLPPALPGGE